jgi:RNA polymerase-binding transcription factor
MRKDIDFDQFKKELETQKTTFKQRLDQETKSLQAYSDSNPDFLDAATKLEAQERKVGSIKYSRGRLAQIEAALRRLEDGKFGICTRCGNDIDIDRLRAKPHAKYCVKCKKITERQR